MEFRLNNGRTVHLTALHQWRTYEGLLEGLPAERINKRRLQELPERACKLCYCDNAIVLPAAATPIEGHDDYPFGKPQALPGITCVGMFKSHSMTNGKPGGHSELAIGWFQEAFALPVAADAEEMLKNVAWEKEAVDVSFDNY